MFASTSPATPRGPVERASARCSSTPAAPGSAGRSCRVRREIYGPTCSTASTSSAGTRADRVHEPSIDCIDDYDDYFAGTDITPTTTPSAQQIIDLAEDFADQCVENNADIIQFIGTNNSARDMDSIRRALGEDEISYFGFSYGSELGGTWATLFPDTVRAAVSRRRRRPQRRRARGSLQQIAGFEATLTTYLAQCSDDPDCAFHNDGDAEGAFDQLMLKLDAKPIPSVPGRPRHPGAALRASPRRCTPTTFGRS